MSITAFESPAELRSRLSVLCVRGLWFAYAVGMAVLTAAYYAFPSVGTHGWLYLLAGISCTAALGAGAAVHAPADHRPWVYLSAGIGLFTAGDTIWFGYDLAGKVSPFPGVADVFYLGGAIVLLLGMSALVRADPRTRDGPVVADAAMVTGSVAVCTWVFLMAPIVADSTLSGPGVAVALAYPLSDLALLYLGLLLIGSRPHWSPTLIAVVVAVGALFAADIAYVGLMEAGTYTNGHPIDALWLLSYGAWGMAALHPSMGEVRSVAERPAITSGLSRGHLAALALLFLGPVTGLLLADEQVEATVAAAGVLGLFGLVLFRMSYVTDELTRLVRSEAALRLDAEEAKQVAESLRQLQRQFATMAAHELRMPLTSLIGSLQTLDRTGSRSPVQVELEQICLRQAARLSRLTEDLLVVAASESGEFGVQCEPVGLADCLTAAVRDLDAVDRVVMVGADSLKVYGDPLRLEQVFSNLVRNALAYADNGTPVTISVTPGATHVATRVHNIGPTIEPARLARIFDQFGHDGPTISGGLGVGLWIVRQLTEAMSGTVTVTSSAASGTEFTVTLPRADCFDAAE